MSTGMEKGGRYWGACRLEERFGVTTGVGGIWVPVGVGKWKVLGSPSLWGYAGPGVPLLMGDRSGGARVPWCQGDAPTLDSEGGPVLHLPARGAGPAHVHALSPRRQLRHPAGTQPG